MFVSVIITTLNEESNIVRCLKSIKQQQDHGQIEIILVDNHSSDQTVTLAKSYVSKTIIAGWERSRQRNIGAKKAQGSWLLFVDADMELTPNVVAECLSLAQSKILPPIIAINEQSVGETFWGRVLACEKNCYQGLTWLCAARFFPRKFFLELGGYDENLVAGEDWDLTQRFLEQGFSMFFTKSQIIHHESKVSLWQLFKKEVYYIKYIDRYAKKHPLAFSYQGSFLYRLFLWVRSWRNLIANPILTAVFMWYKLTIWLIWQWHQLRLRHGK